MIDPTDPDFTLRWPPHLFVAELSRLIEDAEAGIDDDHWTDRVETLLTQAFTDAAPLRQFREAATSRPRFDTDEEPF